MRRIGGVAGVVVVLSVLLAGCDLPRYPDGTQQLSPQTGPAGTGASATSIAADATIRWRWQATGTEDGAVGTPVIRGDLVIVPAFYGSGGLDPNDTNASRVIAFDRLTGEVVWETLVGHDSDLHIAANATTVFAQGIDSGLTALDLATGAERWQADLLGYTAGMGPVAIGGDVYVARQADVEAVVAAYDGATGQRLWAEYVDMFQGGTVRPFAAGDVVYLPGICRSAHAMRRSGGGQVWHHLGPCYGGGRAEGTVRNGRIYVNATDGDVETGGILDQATGAQIGTFEGRFLPVVGRSNLVLAGAGNSLENWSVDGRTRRWRTELDASNTPNNARVQVSPLAASSSVFALLAGPAADEDDGLAAELIGLDVGGGRLTHRIPLGTGFRNGSRSDQQGLAAGNHVLAVAYGDQIVVVG